MCKNELFQSSGTKNELYTKFRDENNILAILTKRGEICLVR